MAFWAQGKRRNKSSSLPFQDILQHTAMPTFVLDSAGEVAFWNTACETLTGVLAEDVMGTKDHWRGFYNRPRPCLADLLLKGQQDDVEGLYEAHSGESAKTGAMQAQNWCELPRGVRRYLLIDAVVVPDKAGKTAYIVETLQDLTIMKEAEVKEMAREIEMAKKRAWVIAKLSDGMNNISEGNLLVRLEEAFPPEIDKIRQDFNKSVSQLATTMTAIGRNGSNVRNCSHELAQVTADMLRGLEQMQQHMSMTMDELDGLARLARGASANTSEAGRVVASARKEAEQSGGVVGQAVRAMGEIEASSRQIGNIISVIDEIAFQTNLLALNAGVEAARAGDAGRGFAVVATEVRALAQRSADAAKEIKALVSTSGTQVMSGVKLVGETGAALNRIVAHVESLNGTISGFSEALSQQSSGLDHMSEAMKIMHGVQGRTSQLVQQVSVVSQTLESGVSAFESLLLNFKLIEGVAIPQQRAGEGKRQVKQFANQ